MRKIAFLLLGISLLLAAPAVADDAVLPSRVAASLGEFMERCRKAGGDPAAPMAVKRADLNGDGREDYIIDASAIGCPGAPRAGDPARPVEVFLGDGADGAELSFSHPAYAVKIEGKSPATKFWLTLSGEGCGKKKARFHDEESFCDRPLLWNAETKKIELAPLSEARVLR